MTPGRIQCLALKRGYDTKAKFAVGCAEPECLDVTHIEVSNEAQVPNVIRKRGWTVTGRAKNSRWWCNNHRQENAR